MAASLGWLDFFLSKKRLMNTETDASFIAVLDTQLGDGTSLGAFWSIFQSSSQANKRCHYTVLVDQLPDKASFSFSGIDPQLKEELWQQWPEAIDGYHRLLLLQGKLTITFIIGDRQTSLSLVTGTFHHLLIHDINTWTIHDFKRLGLLSQLNTLCWTAPLNHDFLPWLKQAGFDFNAVVDVTNAVGVYTRLLAFKSKTKYKDQHAIIVGAGLAGTCLSERLTFRGWHVEIIEEKKEIAQGSSGNLAGVFMPMISKDDNPGAQLTRTAFFFAQQLWRHVGGIGQHIQGEQCGVLQIARDNIQRTAFHEIAQQGQFPESYLTYLDHEQASDFVGMQTGAGIFFPKGGWINPPSVCHAMLDASRSHSGELTLHLARQADQCELIDNEWHVYDEQGQLIAHAPVLILANGLDSLKWLSFEQKTLLHGLWGQVSHLPAASIPVLPTVLTGDGYLTRPNQGTISMGATYNTMPLKQLSSQLHQENLHKLKQFLPTLSLASFDADNLDGRVGVRCVSPDRLPIIGAVPVSNITAKVNPKNVSLNGMYTLLGYASRGLIWSPLCAEILACEINGEPLPINKKLWQSININRFV